MSDPIADEVPYLRTFSNDLAPARLRLCAVLNGFSPTAPERFRYLEVGSGNGDTLVTLAACHPEATFVGVDVNAEHVGFARALAARSGLANVTFERADMADFSADPFDFVAAYGVLSWVAPAKRRAILAASGRLLAPGGLFFASYNALPGWAAVAPLRRLLVEAAANAAGTSLERAAHAVRVAQTLARGGAGYFAHNPAAAQMLARIEQNGLAYAVHEYLMPDWHPLHVEDLAREADACGLHFAGSLPLFLGFRDLAIAEPLLPAFRTIAHRLAYESLRDYANDEFFRKDVFVKGVGHHDPARAGRVPDDLRLGTLGPIQREVRLPHRVVRLDSPVHQAIGAALDDRPATLAELGARLPRLAPTAIADAARTLLVTEQLVPFVRPAPALAPIARPTIALPHDRAVLARITDGDDVFVLAAPAIGAGLALSLAEATALRALIDHDDGAARRAWLRERLTERAIPLGVDAGRSLDERLDVLENEVDVLAARLPKLVQLGVVA